MDSAPDIIVTESDQIVNTPDNMIKDKSMVHYERELKSSLAKLYQNYDFVTDEYDRLYEIVDSLREDYNNSKNFNAIERYKEFRRIIKNSLRKWRTVEKRNALNMSRKTSNTNYTNTLTQPKNPGPLPRVPSLKSMSEDNSQSFTHNLAARLRAQNHSSTRNLYEECTRLEREIYQYKAKNQLIKDILLKLADSYESSKQHVLHIYGRFKELKHMIKEVIDSDV